ncbi:rod shape-determining protein MreD [Sphingomonas ginkgonis]|uniref:Rod shape-determining protein MreD n=1 Tax=Sphingomonas ginkgonis TaxID=2315330 RepID=A0A429VB25_9SPHN|nr:rod shape-determining protein MreD [Sphingomonas ginkgonis]RST31189.1 rod shape-determining protein MreD [Sphingomonas ginkgonis]
MVRAALGTGRIDRGPRRLATYWPAISVVLASALSLLPIVTQTGWFPDFGLVMLLTWRMLRSDVWPSWWAGPLGFANDLLTASPIGLSIALWTGCMLLLDLSDRRTMWRDYWLEWALAALLLLGSAAFRWWIDGLAGSHLPFTHSLPSLAFSILAFPFAARLAGAIDRWRLGR